MFRKVFCSTSQLPLGWVDNDKISPDIKTAKDYGQRSVTDDETGLDRLYIMFSVDSELGGISSELNSVYQVGFVGFLTGALYGGFIHSRRAYSNFVDTNQATAFRSHLEAKKKLQDQVTINFAKGAFRWGWRLALFTTIYSGIITTISVYRGKSSIYEYLMAGTVTGAMFKLNLGLRGIAAGGLIGFAFGGCAGAASLMVMKLSGTSMEEVRYWQYKWRKDRDLTINEGFKKQSTQPKDELMENHMVRVSTKNITLDAIGNSNTKETNGIAEKTN